jgi:hypothetical protein
MVISLYFYNTLVIRFQIVRSIFSNENTMVILALHIIRSITEVLLSTTLLRLELLIRRRRAGGASASISSPVPGLPASARALARRARVRFSSSTC